jgi:hypothetical protein
LYAQDHSEDFTRFDLEQFEICSFKTFSRQSLHVVSVLLAYLSTYARETNGISADSPVLAGKGKQASAFSVLEKVLAMCLYLNCPPVYRLNEKPSMAQQLNTRLT